MESPSSKLPNLTKKTEEFVTMLENEGGKPLYKLSPQEARNVLGNLQKKTYEDIDANVTDRDIFTAQGGNIDVRIIRPRGKEEKLPVILYIHGGGWVMGDKETHDMLVKKLAIGTNSVVIFPNYSHSPDSHYPIALDQIYGLLEYICNNPDDFNTDSNKIVIAGDSVGGNMAAAITLRAKKEDGPKILFQALFYPVTNADMDTKSYEAFKDGPWLTKKAMEWFFDAYAPDKKERNSIYISPLKATFEDLQGLPPALVITNENDVLRDEGEAYARKLDEADVEVFSVRVNGTHHDFMILNALSQTEPAKGAINLACKIIKDVLHP